jgi:hypothetical protein
MFKHLSVLIVSLRQTAHRHGPARSAESLPIADRTGPYAGRAGHKCAIPHAYADCQAGPGRPGRACRADRAETVAGHTRAPPHTHDRQGRAGLNGPDLRADHVRETVAGASEPGAPTQAGPCLPGRAGRGYGAQATMASRSMCAATCSHACRALFKFGFLSSTPAREYQARARRSGQPGPVGMKSRAPARPGPAK